jgi:hypothetical protein
MEQIYIRDAQHRNISTIIERVHPSFARLSLRIVY